MDVEEVVAIIEKVTAEEMRTVAKELLVGDKLRLSVVGPVNLRPPRKAAQDLVKIDIIRPGIIE